MYVIEPKMWFSIKCWITCSFWVLTAIKIKIILVGGLGKRMLFLFSDGLAEDAFGTMPDRRMHSCGLNGIIILGSVSRSLRGFLQVSKQNVITTLHLEYTICLWSLGVKVRNMKMDFNNGGTWRRVGQWTLMMKIYDFFYSAKSFSCNKR